MLPYQQLIVWQKGMDLVIMIYHLTDDFPKREQYGLSDQLRRASVSIPSNIAEGNQRHTRNDRLHFLDISFGSCAEVNTQLEIAKRLSYISSDQFKLAYDLTVEVEKMLNVMISR